VVLVLFSGLLCLQGGFPPQKEHDKGMSLAASPVPLLEELLVLRRQLK
jgi:hypothetical protein